MMKALKQKRGTPISTKFAPPCVIIFMADLEEDKIQDLEYKAFVCWRYIDKTVFLWEHGEKK